MVKTLFSTKMGTKISTDIKYEYDEIKKFLLNSFFAFVLGEKTFKKKELNEIYKFAIIKKYFDIVSVVMSIIALDNYKNGERYYKTLSLLNDAKYLSVSSESLLAQKVNMFCLSIVEYYEKNLEISLNFLRACLYIKTEYEDEFESAISKYKEKIESENQKDTSLNNLKNLKDKAIYNSSEIKNDALLALLQVGRTIAVETDIDKLLTTIAEQIQQALSCDRCSVYLWDEKKNELWSKVALGLKDEEIRFPADKGLAGRVFQTGETVNIKNAYENEFFNREIDKKTGYKTKNILCMPIRNLEHKIIGVFQVLNKTNGDFNKKDEDLLFAISSQAGIALENAALFSKQKKLIDEQKKLFSSFIDTLAASIDARDKITSGHSKRVTMYADLICEKLKLSENEKEIIKNASLLHDIGKIGIKDSVLQKEGKLSDSEFNQIKEHAKLTHGILSRVYMFENFMAENFTAENFREVALIASTHHEKVDGTGYYKGLKGNSIPLGGRILAVCDVFDAITSKRHYRNKMEITDAIKIIKEGKNRHFDSELAEVFLNLPLKDILKVILNDSNYDFKKDEKLLKSYCLNDLYETEQTSGKKSLKNPKKQMVEVFNKYYQRDCK